MKKASWIEAFPELMHALGQTAWMVGASFVIVTVLGLALGVVLRLSSPDGLNPQPVIYQVVGAIVNIARSLPFLILMIALLSFTRWLVGTAYGPTAAVVPLSVGAMTMPSLTAGVAQMPLSSAIDQTTGSSGCDGSSFTSWPTSWLRALDDARSTCWPK